MTYLNSFTTTNYTKEEQEATTGVVNRDYLNEKINSMYPGKSVNMIKAYVKGLNTFLDEVVLKIDNEVDPIYFLYYLYYNQKKSILQISLVLNDLGVNISEDTLYYYTQKFFGWKLNISDRQLTTERNERRSNGILNDGEGKNIFGVNEKIVEIIEKETAYLIKKIESKTKKGVNNILLEDLDNKKNKIDKLIYIFANYGLLKNETLKEFLNFLKVLKHKGLSVGKIANIFNNVIKNFNPTIDLKITNTNISWWILGIDKK
ncbi:MAG: hypothetical protein PHN31_00530 [Candidatus Gracilibacteria bacterium]|nr:hypothetical protein [Candidatus Gracilibacteria bacterium]